MKQSLCFLILFFTITIHSQTKKGSVVDPFDNVIENAYLFNTKSERHAHTDQFGKFSLDKTDLGDIINITALGYKKTSYVITDSEIKIVLESSVFQLSEVMIQPKLSAMNVITKIDLNTNSVNSSQEILRKVPGLFIGQHAGGGKAEQLFLRGFDIDHGTDIAISVDGMPVNMPSHAHGQGYADLHFVIPETVEKIDFGKGTYYADKGDFATAGYVAFKTKDKLEKSNVSLEIGQFNTQRILGMFNLLGNKKQQSAYIASEFILTDGPFENPQNFSRINLFGKYTSVLDDNTKIAVTGSTFTSVWDASGQIPQRLIDNGTLSRFGAVDATEGGKTSRTNLNFALTKAIDQNTVVKANAFYSKYDFELYSNFTFFLEDPINGDQIKQKENRSIYGLNTEFERKLRHNDWKVLLQTGLGFRADYTLDTELSHTLNRTTTLETLKLGDISEFNGFNYWNAEFSYKKWMINTAVRFDYFKFIYQDKLSETFKTASEKAVKVSPKLNFIYSYSNDLQFFVKSGTGFHSNDARVVVANNGKQILPTAIGTDIGTIWKPTPKLLVNAAAWYLYLEQEFVYVGDAGIIEPSGKSKRMGLDFGLRYQLNNWLFFDGDTNYTYARSIDEPEGQNYIPLAPDFTATGGLSFKDLKGFSGGLHGRYLKSRPANEDNSIVAKGYAVADFDLKYQYKNTTVGFSIQNIFNTQWNETQFATESRLKNEPNSVEEIHFTPGTPFFIKGMIGYRF